MAEIIGPLSRAVQVAGTGRKARLHGGPGQLATSNAQLLVRRCVVVESGRGERMEIVDPPTHGWAVRHNLGQGGTTECELAKQVRARRVAALRSLEHTGLTCAIISLTPQAAVVAGTGESGVQNVGIALHGTYGWPTLRASTLKGVAHAYARRDPAGSRGGRTKVFGAPRPPEDDQPVAGEDTPGGPDDDAARGEVTFLDALPCGLLRVMPHVLTPHVRPYYAEPEPNSPRKPPAEYYDPEPVTFLAVQSEAGSRFLAAIVGPADAVGRALEWLRDAAAELGIGAKTAAGYGYLRVEKES